ncbi:MAG: type 4a pilus biogenesis protein PilO [Candidatus Zixiibacteriota bacterium]|nr:MAG: type 4a pilus biogenesis protein PilO [candidate division Zixibacteria bacterium]
MNLRDPKTQITLVIALIFLVLYYVWFAKIYGPYQDKISQKEIQKGVLLKKLHDVQATAASLSDLQKEYNEKQIQYKKVEILLPEIREDEAFLNQLHAAAQLTNSVVTNVTPLGTVPSEFYETNNYSVEVEATYHGLGKFMAKVANFPFIVNLNDITLKSPAQKLAMIQAESVKDEKPVTATFKVSTYNVRQGQGL